MTSTGTSTGEQRDAGQRPGPVYDAAMRGVVEGDLPATLRLLGIARDGPVRVLTGALPLGVLEVDLLVQVGERRLVHVEYVRTPGADLVARMLIYRGLVMRAHPGAVLSQHVIVLGQGRVRGHDEPASSGFRLDLAVLYLREIDPQELLAHGSGLAALAVLGRGGRPERTEAFARALRMIVEEGGDRQDELLQFASVLASIRLDAVTITETVKEVGMTIESLAEFFRDTEVSEVIARQARERGLQEGRQQGRQEGRQEGLLLARCEVLTTLLRDRFGDAPGLAAAAERLAGWPDAASAVRAVTGAATLADIPEQPPA